MADDDFFILKPDKDFNNNRTKIMILLLIYTIIM